MRKKLLIVEDEFIVANDLRLILSRAGYVITGIASSAAAAEKLLQKERPDLVILDIRLEGKLSGIDFARRLQQDNIAFVYLSANATQDVLEEAKKTEPYGFLVKPFREKDLLVALDIAWYRHTHSQQANSRREEQLTKQLAAISDQSLTGPQLLLAFARTIQLYIPFDFLCLEMHPPAGAPLRFLGYLRIGFGEYQFVGEEELATISGASQKRLSALFENLNDSIDREKDTGSGTAIQHLLRNTFDLQDRLIFPLESGHGLSVTCSFHSRKPTLYTREQMELLDRLKTFLKTMVQQIVAGSNTMQAAENTVQPGLKKSSTGFEGIIGNHYLLLGALDLAAQVAPFNTSVLLLGESGTGKEKVAASIHQLSLRKRNPFIKINCAAIPETLVESELFGHEKGAFTGALQKRRGRFEQADGGTIFLDEIGELLPAMQVKLLRVLQEKEIEPLGSNGPIKVDVRIIAATNRHLEKEVAEGRFRLDLYHRLNVFPIILPALRERKSDIEALAIFFAQKFCAACNKPFHGLTTGMLEKMQAYDWPGNIRELENVMEQSVVMNNGHSKLESGRNFSLLGMTLGKSSINTLDDVKQLQQSTERNYIASILKITKGRIRGANGAAERLNLKPSTLESKMARLQIRRDDFIDPPEID